MSYSVQVEKFGHGKLIRVHTPALRCAFATLGAAVISTKLWDKNKSRWIEVHCALPCPKEYDEDIDFMGSTVGRYAGRIKDGTFTLDGETYNLSRNMKNLHNLHGGTGAFHKRHWSFETVETADVVGVRFSLVSPHMDLGFPAEVHCFAYYYIELKRPNVINTEYSARIPERSPADATVVGLFSHVGWNLNGVPEEDNASNPHWKQADKIYNIQVKLPCSRVVETDRCAIPTGELKSVEGTCLDFRRGKPLGEDIEKVDFLDRDPCGYDHPLCVDEWDAKRRDQVLFNGEAYSPATKIQLKIYSTYPCIWVYTANNKPATVTGEKGQRWGRHSWVCLLPQNYPDCPNRPEFPSCVLRKGETYFEKLVNEFNVLKESHV